MVGLERRPLILVSASEELLGRKISGSGLEYQDYGRMGSAALTSLADLGHGLFASDVSGVIKKTVMGWYNIMAMIFTWKLRKGTKN
jgi:hypothetical protein